ncbi:MAG: aminopeptidase P family N-terminal domain-containing protein, partial [Actinomycetota bacterium]|nr:aminopeptidase P family N-terminal domain-containing protein [Actinomycetota bacterium]
MDYGVRVDKLRAAIGELEAGALLVTNLTNVRYLTGFSGSNGQVLVTADAARFLTDGRYRARAKEIVRGADVSIYLNRMTDELGPMLDQAGVTTLAVEGKTMTLAQRDDLDKRLDGVKLVSSEGVVEKLRRIKEPAEIAKLREAIAIGDRAYGYILDRLTPGRTEREIALDLEVFMRTNGADEISFEPIVGSGPLSAHIHHTPSERALEK